MFDSIFMPIKCPFCGQTFEMECQTKDLDCRLHRWKVGDNTEHPEEKELYCCATCASETCPAYETRTVLSCRLGRGRLFDLIVETPLGLITGKYRLVGFDKAIDAPFQIPGHEHVNLMP